MLIDTDKQNLFNDLVKFVLRMEGGLTSDTTDSASNFPLKGTYKVGSKTFTNPHTNKGITYKTFVDSANLGYKPTDENFLNMPSDIWLKIFKEKYYSKTLKFSDNIVLNSYLSLWYWGGWNTKQMSVQRVANVLASNYTNDEKLKKLTELRKEYFDNIIKTNPTYVKYEKGWKNRADEFYNEFKKYT